MSFALHYARHLGRLLESIDPAGFDAALELIRQAGMGGGKVIVAGNGGSAAIASHVAVDLTKTAGIRAITFNDADLITCFANDFGYEHWLARAVESYADAHDTIVLISSSGRSPNIINAARKARAIGAAVVTLSGFAPDNPLRAEGTVNLWVDSTLHNFVEMTHQVWLLAMVDVLAGVSPERVGAGE